MQDALLSFDSFGSSINLNFRGKETFSSVCGSLISLFLYTTFLLYALQQGLEFVNKSQFNIQSYSIIDLEGLEETVSLKEARSGIIISMSADNTGGKDKFLELDPRLATLKV